MSARSKQDPSEDRWLREVGRVTREKIAAEDLRRLDARWDAYAAGDLTAQQQASLLEGSDASAEQRQAGELFRPLDETFKDQLARQTLTELAEGAGASRAATGRGGWKKRLLEWLLGHRGAAWGLLATVSALLVAVLGPRLLRTDAPLPTFNLDITAVTASMRSAGAPFTAGVVLQLRLQPATKTRLQPELRLYARSGDHLVRWTEAEQSIGAPNPNGVLVFTTPPWQHGTGEWTLLVAIGRRGSLPSDAELGELLLAGLPPPQGAEWQLLEESLDIESPPGS